MAESAPEMSFDIFIVEVSTDAAAPLWVNRLMGQLTQISRPSTHLPTGAEALLNQLLALPGSSEPVDVQTTVTGSLWY